jgi:hypothetical protein
MKDKRKNKEGYVFPTPMICVKCDKWFRKESKGQKVCNECKARPNYSHTCRTKFRTSKEEIDKLHNEMLNKIKNDKKRKKKIK